MDSIIIDKTSGLRNGLQRIARSWWFDLLGVAIVIACAWMSGYLFETLGEATKLPALAGYAWVPFGFISVASSICSLMSTRLTGRLTNWGNVLGVINVFFACGIDFILGNKAAPITYAVTLILQGSAVKTWMDSEKNKAREPLTGTKAKLALIGTPLVALAVSFGLNLIAYGKPNVLFWVTTIVFALSLTANFLNVLKLTVQWQYWLVYNFVQLVKALVQGNFANVGKYIYYIINSIADKVNWDRS